MQIAKLEHELGQTLFDRHAEGMTPTPRGRRLPLFAPLLEQLLTPGAPGRERCVTAGSG